MVERRYEGDELALFAEAHNWKRYFAKVLEPHLRGHVLEVGAGRGTTSRMLARAPRVTAFTGLEPDPGLCRELSAALRDVGAERGMRVRALPGTLPDLASDERFDTIAYVDVLEHIEDDRGELLDARERLRTGGRLLVLAPAHAALYSEFDRAIGHFRRYDAASLRALTPAGLRLVALRYLDSAGLVASLANRLLLKAARPTRAQIRLWDGWMIPISRVLDAVTFGALGKSIVAVWERE